MSCLTPVNLYVVFDGADLPIQFSYELPVPQRRITLHPTEGDVSMQVTSAFVAQDSFINWECLNSDFSEYKTFLEKYYGTNGVNVANNSFTFVGYWGDSYTVRFHSLDQPSVTGQRFDVSGSFQILTVTTWLDGVAV